MQAGIIRYTVDSVTRCSTGVFTLAVWGHGVRVPVAPQPNTHDIHARDDIRRLAVLTGRAAPTACAVALNQLGERLQSDVAHAVWGLERH